VIGRFFPQPKLRYAIVHEIGMTIRPKHGPYLVFPVGPHVSGAKRGGPFVRVKQVTIPARPVWAEAAKTIEPAVDKRFEEALERAVRVVGG
jgi:hypothetical protein